ncbi:DUF1571 domain-containing protein [Reichenbachiella agarivorans]|uniref:DUF1571 domain-containing protein n=1 Tax=Reichenbachiella agarivorans TaxID=2979464 RepID=A0ABY6CML4_9BACT|nr:DUF1571 domain-containing protein [Reichenbachiella agarivorans]UXP31758.1 DUF1571 domain-containing protein [Reichenbachiella agarivorans]
MKKKCTEVGWRIKYFRLLLWVLFIGSSHVTLAQTGYELAQNMFSAAKSVSSMKFTMKKTERVDGKLLIQVSKVKLSINPYKVYTNQQEPNKGLEVLYCAGLNDGKAFINPISFPWITLKLDPTGDIMRTNQHHTIQDSGYKLVMSILEHIVNKYGEESKTMISKINSTQWEGKDCYAIELKNPYFKYIEYTVKNGETLVSIENRLKLSGFMILEKNKLDQDYDQVVPGMTLWIPTDYSPHMIIYMDKLNYLPVMMKIFDDQGLFELYEYLDVQINPVFSKNEFSSDFPSYGF